MRCAGITKGGERCKLDATSGSYCWSHAPENAIKRSRRGRKGGKARGASGEIHEVKREIRRIIKALEDRTIDTKVGNAMFVGYSRLLQALELERNVKETEELAPIVEQLWQEREQRKRKAV